MGAAVSLRRLILGIVRFVTICCLVVAICFAFAVIWELWKVPNLAFLNNYQPVADLQIFDKQDKLVCKVEGVEQRNMIPLSKINPYLQRAVLSAEDHHFYEHHGIDIIGICRAILANISAGHPVQGGSTITQQLAKNLFFEDEKRTIQLKVAEAIVASQLEGRFSKEKILELYLNEVYFGNGAYGIEQAARRYFGKPAANLSIAESAYIAGIIRSPSRGGMSQYRTENINRQQEVLEKMRQYGYISNEQFADAQQQPLYFKTSLIERKVKCTLPRYPYYLSYVLELVRRDFSEGEMQRHGLKIYTNLDQSAQQAAERCLSASMRYAPAGMNQAALVSVSVKDGAVLALVGGVGNYLDNQWNCATNPHTVGSAFKPFVYLAGFCRGTLHPNSLVEDTPLTVRTSHNEEYKPKNYDGKFMGPVTVAEAMAYSRNVCAVRVAQNVGIDSVIQTAHLAGIKQELEPHLSLALGCAAVSPLDMAGAYSTFARGGVAIQPTVIRRIENRHGWILRSYTHDSVRVFDTDPVAKLVDVLQQVVVQGTAQQAQLGNRPVAGKTGTADQAKDLWFVGFTPDLVTAVWGGNEDNKPIYGSHVTGGTVMARIWRDYNRAYYAKHAMPSGWFIACTKLVGHFQPQKAISVTPKPRRAVRAASYPDSSYSYANYTPRQRPAARATQRGVTEYRWNR